MSDTESKSEIRRLAFQDPTGTAAKLIQCQAQLAQAHETIKQYAMCLAQAVKEIEAVRTNGYEEVNFLKQERDKAEQVVRDLCEQAHVHHPDCIIRDLKDLTQERDRLKTQYEAVKNDPDYQQCCALREKAEADYAALVALVREVLNAGVEFEDPRISYKTIQLDKTWFDDAKAALEARRGMEG